MNSRKTDSVADGVGVSSLTVGGRDRPLRSKRTRLLITAGANSEKDVMTNFVLRPVTATVIAFALQAQIVLGQATLTDLKAPPGPSNLEVPAGNAPYLKSHAIGTQNYVCVPGADGSVWKFLGPQATLFVKIPWIQGPVTLQAATHFLSSNPLEGGMARPAWQGSIDTSVVWGKAIADSTDPNFVAPGAIPWLLLEAAGAQQGPTGGSALSQTTFIQRVNTSGGVAPAAGCDGSVHGKIALVPYTTDYVFYQATGRK
jgi:hypothetical protein